MSYEQQKVFWRGRRERILHMLKSGISQAEIARQMGVKRQRVYQIVVEEKGRKRNGRKAA